MSLHAKESPLPCLSSDLAYALFEATTNIKYLIE